MFTTYELIPKDGRKSFYGKCRVREYPSGKKILISYNTEVMQRNPDGTYKRLWAGWSNTTGRHIYAFCNLRKIQLDKMDIGKNYKIDDLM